MLEAKTTPPSSHINGFDISQSTHPSIESKMLKGLEFCLSFWEIHFKFIQVAACGLVLESNLLPADVDRCHAILSS